MSVGGQTMHTLRPYIFDAIARIGDATPEQVHAALPQFTLKKIQTSMWNAQKVGLLAIASKTKRRSTYRLAVPVPDGGFVAAKEMARLFTPNRRDKCGPRYPSVWAYAQSFVPARYVTERLRVPTLATVWNTRSAA